MALWASSPPVVPMRRYTSSTLSLSALPRVLLHARSSGRVLTTRRTNATLSADAPQPEHIAASEVPRKSSIFSDDSLVSIGDVKNKPGLSRRCWGLRVYTLDHTRLSPDDFLDLSNKRVALARAYVPSTPGGIHYVSKCMITLQPTGMRSRRFPEHARGFLYYHLAANAPPLSGQVRFRVTGTNDPALFASGQDLLRDDGIPWRIPLLHMANAMLDPVRRRLLDDGLVSEELLRMASSVLPSQCSGVHMMSPRVLHALGQPFPLTFGMWSQNIFFIGAETVAQARLPGMGVPRMKTEPGAKVVPILKGSVLCRFEKSALPKHAGRRVAVCRVLRFLEPVVSTGVMRIPDALMPREGELLRTSFKHRTREPGRVFDIDQCLSRDRNVQLPRGLALLYDNEARAGGPVSW